MSLLRLPNRTIALLSILSAVAVALVWKYRPAVATTSPAPLTEKLPTPTARPLGADVLRVAPRDMRAVVRQEALLKPDRRIVLAFEELARVTTPGAPGAATVTSRNRTWTIEVGGGVKATLPTIPGFFDALEALRAAGARGLSTRGGQSLGDAERRRLTGLASDPFGDAAVRAIRECDRLWEQGYRGGEVLDILSQAFASVCLQTPDALEVADVLRGRALGLLAAAEVASNRRFEQREVLLSYVFGNRGEAYDHAQNLRNDEAVRLFVHGPDAALEGLAASPGAPRLALYLAALRLAETMPVEGVRDWLTHHGVTKIEADSAVPVLFDSMDRFDGDAEMGARLALAGWTAAGLQGNGPGPGMLAAFEQAIRSRAKEKGPLWDDVAATGRARALFLSGLWRMGRFYLDTLASGPAANAFIENLGKTEAGPGAEFRRWYRGLAAEKNGEIRAETLVDGLEGDASLGQAALRRTGTRLFDALSQTGPAKPRAAAILERTLDSRVTNDSLFSTVCAQSLLNPVAAEEYHAASVLSVRRGTVGEASPAYRARDVMALRAMASGAGVSPYETVHAVMHLQELGVLAPQELRTYLLDVLERNPDAWTATRSLRLLWQEGFLAEGEAWLRSWFRSHRDEHILTQALYASRLEHILFLQGRYQEAWETIAPYVSTYKGDALWAGAEALEGLGRHAEALEMSTQMLDRYSDQPVTRLDHALLLWRQGRFDDAAKVLLDASHPIGSKDWNELVVPRFFELFAAGSQGDTVRAVDALARAGGDPGSLSLLAEPFASRKRSDFAAAILAASGRGRGETIDGSLREYRYRKVGKGEKAANEWLLSQVARGQSATLVADAAFDGREFGLLWLLPESEDVWLLRAAAAAFEGGAEAGWRELMLGHFRDPKTPASVALYGRFLLGAETEETLLGAATDAPSRSDTAFVLGMKAAGEKRYADACDWLRVCVRAGLTASSSTKHAEATLKMWDKQRFGVRGGADIR